MTRRTGTVLLWTLASLSLLLLVYEAWTLIGSVLRPLLANPQVIQTDFHYYYDAARRFSRDQRQLYLMADDVIAGFAYPPPAIVPFVWLSRWPLGTALLTLTILSYLMIAVAIQQWLKYLGARGHVIDRMTAIAITVIVFALGPTYMNAIFGQVNAFVLASAVAFVRLAPAAPFEAGLSLALGAWLKIYPAYLAVIALWERSAWKAIGWAIAVGIVIMIVLLPFVPLQAYRDFIHVLDARIDKTAIHFTNQSLSAFLERFRFSSDLFLYWTGQQAITVSPLVRALNTSVTGAAAVALWKSRASREKKAAVLMALIPMIAPLGWGHTYVMVLPLVMLQLLSIRDAAPVKAAAIGACVATLMIPAGRHLPIDAAPDWLENIVYSRYLLATSVLMFISSARVVGQKTESTVIASA
jgi:alpha-1,2-mannosyltransferase